MLPFREMAERERWADQSIARDLKALPKAGVGEQVPEPGQRQQSTAGAASGPNSQRRHTYERAPEPTNRRVPGMIFFTGQAFRERGRCEESHYRATLGERVCDRVLPDAVGRDAVSEVLAVRCHP